MNNFFCYAQKIIKEKEGPKIISKITSVNKTLLACGDNITSFKIEQDVCNPKQVLFTNINPNAITTTWSFDDGGSGAGASIIHTYNDYGIYNVTMTVVYDNGCIDGISKEIPVFLGADGSLILTPDITVCAGDEIQLNTFPGTDPFCWKPAPGLTDITNRNPTVKPTATTTYYFQSRFVGQNLVKNADFSQGNVDINSSYAYMPVTDYGESQYFITTNPNAWHSGFQICGDHTSGNGNMMVINGSPTANVVVWSQSVVVKPQTTYSFSLWIGSVNPAAPASLRFQINGVLLGNDVNAGDSACSWREFSTLWNSGNNTTAVITIVNNNTIISGNDYALDDISFATSSVSYDSVLVTVAPKPIVKTIDDASVCEGIPIKLTTTGAVSYSWSPSNDLSNGSIADPLATPATTTQYIVTGNNSDGCNASDTVIITVDPLPIIDLGGDASICTGGSYSIPGNLQGANQFTWSPSTGLSDPTLINPTASPTITTQYLLTATSSKQCIAKNSITINVLPALPIKAGNDVTICEGTSTPLSATGAASYSWSPSTGLSNPSIANPVASPTVTTQYIVAGVSAEGCVGKDTVNIIVDASPAISLGPDAAVCSGTSYSIPGVASNATKFSWTPTAGLSDATIANPVASPTATITYTVTASNGQCEAKDAITINVAASLQIKTINDTAICGMSPVTLTTTAVPGGTYSWSPAAGLSDPTIASPVATPSSPTKYIVTVTTPEGCVGKDSVNVSMSPQPTINIGPDAALCTGNSYTIPGVASNATKFSWTPTAGLSDATIANPVASPTATTTYTVTASNGQCEAKDAITINVAASLQIKTINDTALCGMSPITLTTTAVPGGTYSWSPAAGLSDPTIASPVATPSSPTKYIVTVTTPEGCVGKDSVNVSMSPQPTINIGPDAALCTGNSYTIPGVASNATKFSWTPTAGLSDATIANPVASPTATTTYTVTASNGQCEAKNAIIINVAASLQIKTINDTAICGMSPVTLTTTAVPGGTYSWSPAAGLSDPTIASPVATPSSPTKYIVTVTTPEGCVGKDSVNVSMSPQPTINIGPDEALCTGNSYTIPGVASNATKFSWTPTAGLSDATIANPVASPTATTTYTVTASNGQCEAKDTMALSISASITVTPINDTSICVGNSVPLRSTIIPNAKYQWIPATGLSDPTSPTPIASPATTTNYILNLTTADGCKGSDSVLVTVSSSPEITMSNDATVCIGNQVTLNAQSFGAKQYQWSPATGLSDPRNAQPVATINSTTTYAVAVTNVAGCVSTDSVTITAAPLPQLSVSKSNDIDCAHSEVQLSATGGSTFNWSPSTGLDNPLLPNPIAKPTATTTYLVTATSIDGCTASSSVTIDVKAAPGDEFFIPNAFTPNNDGLNDCFGLRSANITSPFQFEVYNRWGEKVFATSNTTICWDGTYKGSPQPGDAYVWQIKVKDECGEVYKKGTVVLVR